MAGYYLYSLDHDVFAQLTTSPTGKQGELLADDVIEELESLIEEYEDDLNSSIWPFERHALAERIVERLAKPDWYSDLSFADAVAWDQILGGLHGEPGQEMGIGFEISDYESIYWDCAEIAAKEGASMMAEPNFGNKAFRYFGQPTAEYVVYPMYTIYLPDQTRELLKQLERVEPHFAGLDDDSEGSPKDQFFEGLFPAVNDVVARGRVLWVETDT